MSEKNEKEIEALELLRKLLWALDHNEWKDGKVMKEVREFLLQNAINDFCDKKEW